jgi:hypothetical protein
VTAADNEHFLRDKGHNGLDSVAFHYSIYRSISRFLGMDGNLQVAYDVPVDFTEAWQEMFVTNDFLNWDSGEVDPTHMLGTSNFDIFRWPSLEAGVLKSASATFITNLLVPGVPLVSSWSGHLRCFVIDGCSCSTTTARSKTSTCSTLARPTTSTGSWRRSVKLGEASILTL